MVPVLNMGRSFLGQEVASYQCPPTPAPGAPGELAFPVTIDPTLNCMRDARGNTICSDGMKYPPGCPKTPPPEVFSPGVTPDVVTNGMIEGAVPPPRGGAAPVSSSGAPAVAGGPPSPLLMVGAGALGAAALGVAAYFLFGK